MGRKIQDKIGRYAGRGESLIDAIIGEHWLGAEFFPSNLAAGLFGWNTYCETCGYNAADWTETKENSGTIAMAAGGLLFTTGGADGNSCNIQLIRSATPAANLRIIAGGRLQSNDMTNTGIVFGLHNTDSDYWSTEPTHQAVLFKDKGAATFVGRTKDGTTGSSSSTLLTGANDTAYDFMVLYDGVNSAVFFGVKLASAAWAKSNFTKKATNLPASALRLTFNIENNEGAANTMTVARRYFAEELAA